MTLDIVTHKQFDELTLCAYIYSNIIDMKYYSELLALEPTISLLRIISGSVLGIDKFRKRRNFAFTLGETAKFSIR